MTTYRSIALAVIFGLTLGGCTSGSSGPTCSFNDPARMPPTPGATPGSGSAWPKFRANEQNTGAVANVTVSMEAQILRRFTPPTPIPGQMVSAQGSFVASPSLNNGESAIYIGATNNTMYKVYADPTQSTTFMTQDTSFNLVATQPITSSAVVAVRDGNDAIFVGGADGRLYAATNTGEAQASFWPFGTGAYVSASPVLGFIDGTVYVGAENGIFNAVCPNGVFRFGGTTATIASSAALDSSSNVYVGANDRQLRSFEYTGPLRWAFSASAPIVTAPVVELPVVSGNATYVYTVDLGGRVFKVNAANGLPVMAGPVVDGVVTPVGPIASSPALANGHLYFGSDDGNLYSVNSTTGDLEWTVSTGGPIGSSPAVAVVGPTKAIIVVGSMDGNLYIVDDTSPSTPHVVPLRLNDGDPIEPIGSSPAIRSDGTIFIGTDGCRIGTEGCDLRKAGGHVYALK